MVQRVAFVSFPVELIQFSIALRGLIYFYSCLDEMLLSRRVIPPSIKFARRESL